MARIAITGGPGAGKTTLLLALRERGHRIVGDSANFAHHAATPGHVFFDRSVVDALGGLDGVAPLSQAELGGWLANHPYFPKVFVLPPWQAIYVNDGERDHTFEHAEAVDRSLRAWCRRCRYDLIEVPRVPVAERCAHVLRALADGAP